MKLWDVVVAKVLKILQGHICKQTEAPDNGCSLLSTHHAKHFEIQSNKYTNKNFYCKAQEI